LTEGSRSASAAAVGCYNPTPQRTIYGEGSSDVAFSVIYGQQNDPVNGTWTNCIDGLLTIGLQMTSHLATLEAFSFLENQAVDLSGSITMQKMNGILPSNTVDSVGYSNLNAAGFNFSTFLGGTSNGVYSVKLGTMTINDYSKAHTFQLDVDLSTYRFVCQTREQCRYPDGNEAPVFG
jgi:hypothetical protein